MVSVAQRTGFGVVLQPRIHHGLALIGVLCCSCSFAIDTREKQCTSDADCSARGLVGTTCVAHLCQPIASSAGAGSMTLAVDGQAGAPTPPANPVQVTDAPDAGKTPVAGAPAGAGGALGTGTAGSAAEISEAAGAPAAGGGASGGASGAKAEPAPCKGESCPECSVDADCKERGSGATCVDSKCWTPPPECKEDKDCEPLGAVFVGGGCVASKCRPNPKWRCEPAVVLPAVGMMTLTVPIVDALSVGRVSGVKVVACNKLDLMCASPVAEGTSDREGMAKLTVPMGFAGYLQVTTRSDYVPALYFLPTVPPEGMLPNFPLLTSGAILNALAFALGAGLDPQRGHMMLIAHDCMGTPLPGVTFTSEQADKSTLQFYVQDQLPSAEAKQTPAAGDGGYVNFPAGTALITAKEVATGIELAKVSVLVRPGFISVLYIRPESR